MEVRDPTSLLLQGLERWKTVKVEGGFVRSGRHLTGKIKRRREWRQSTASRRPHLIILSLFPLVLRTNRSGVSKHRHPQQKEPIHHRGHASELSTTVNHPLGQNAQNSFALLSPFLWNSRKTLTPVRWSCLRPAVHEKLFVFCDPILHI